MKPYKIIKPHGQPRKIRVVGNLPYRRVPLYFIKKVHPFVFVEFTNRDQTGHQQDSSGVSQDP